MEKTVPQPPVPNSTAENKLPEAATTSTTAPVAGTYIPYSDSAYNESSGMKRVLFFHAPWCPTCKRADKAFSDNPSRIPDGVLLLKADYDTQKALKAKYAVTYQHTFVYVDSVGNPIRIWNGGDLNELIANTK
jgi:thiol-disulfide isomerase/thioredoxin